MPNWCENYITIEPIKKDGLKNLIKTIKNGTDEYLFARIFGDVKDYRETFGTKWDVEMSEADINGYMGELDELWEDDSFLTINIHTAWSPCLGFSQKLSEKYGLSITHQYFEGGNDFSGEFSFRNGEVIEEQEYNFLEGLYKLDNERFYGEAMYQAECTETIEEFLEKFLFVDVSTIEKLEEIYNEQKAIKN